MLRIPCPHCGLRDLVEFRYGGEAGLLRPRQPQTASDSEWAEYLYFRDNLKGPQRERWVHIHGCRQWFERVRDTYTHDWHPDPAAPEADV